MTPLPFHPRHPFKPPWWRSGRARQLHDGRLRARRIDDDLVRRARRLLAALGRHGGDPGHPRVVAADPPVAAAYGLRASPDTRPRLEVEARALAGQDGAEIAARVGLDAAMIGAYLALFFDVRGSLAKVDWVGAVVFGAAFYDGRGTDADLGVKALAYALGPVAVDVLTGRAPGPVDRGLAEALRLHAEVLAAPVTPGTARRWLALAGQLDELGRRAAEASAAPVSRPVRVDEDVLSAAMGEMEAATASTPPVDDRGRVDLWGFDARRVAATPGGVPPSLRRRSG